MLGRSVTRFISITLVFLAVSNNSTEPNVVVSECYKLYCYHWINGIARSEGLKQCHHPYWNLEIYSEAVQMEVVEFISWQYHTYRSTIKISGTLVPLDLICTSQNQCTWRRNNESASYYNWNETKFNEITEVYMLASHLNSSNKWYVSNRTYSNYSRICMSEISISPGFTKYTTISREELVHATKPSDVKNERSTRHLKISLIALAVVVLVVVLALAFFATRKKRRKGEEKGNAKTHDSQATAYAEVVRKEEKSHYYYELSAVNYAELDFSAATKGDEPPRQGANDLQVGRYQTPNGDIYSQVNKS